eukprot:TRINITY_DN43958_c0_g1_i1.p1 TRINITY_DN43958_c0_g1~~TRINITY_DN43958_c0_g1_i1.p1  ORF type:complete len:256 (+),score=75.56 TRINITY_DN43958_c0_g1_i1:96-770(+)
MLRSLVGSEMCIRDRSTGVEETLMMLASSTRASIYPGPDIGNASKATFGAKLAELMELNPERARAFIRTVETIPPSDKLDIARATGTFLTRQNLRDIDRADQCGAIEAVAGCIEGKKCEEERDAGWLSRAEQQVVYDTNMAPERLKKALRGLEADGRRSEELLRKVTCAPERSEDWQLELLLPYQLRSASSFGFTGASRSSRQHMRNLRADRQDIYRKVMTRGQ